MSTDIPTTEQFKNKRLRFQTHNWIFGIQLIWLSTVMFGICVLIVALPLFHESLSSLCKTSECGPFELTLSKVGMLNSLGVTVPQYVLLQTIILSLIVLVWFIVAGIIAISKFNNLMTLVTSLMLILVGVMHLTGNMSSFSEVWEVISTIVGALEVNIFFLFLALFPHGRFIPRWTVVIPITVLLMSIISFVAPNWTENLGFLWFVIFAFLIGCQIYRYRKCSKRSEKQQMKWILFSFFIILLFIFLLTGMQQWSVVTQDNNIAWLVSIISLLSPVIILFIPISIGYAILRHNLWDIDFIIHHSIVYGALSAFVVVFYIIIVGGLGSLLSSENNIFLSLVATGLIAVLFQPFRNLLQIRVKRLIYGVRDEPFLLITRLGKRLETVMEPDEMLKSIIEVVREGLKLPYAAFDFKTSQGFEIGVELGETVSNLTYIPVNHKGEVIGRLSVSSRSPGEELSREDKRVLDALAREAGVAVHSVRLTTQLQRSRLNLVTVREEERRRLRRDLHDGIGPLLAAQTLKAGTARHFLTKDPSLSNKLLMDLEKNIKVSLSTIKRIIYDLRPPTLDELGLLGAIKDCVVNYDETSIDNGTSINYTVNLPDMLPPLPAAIEVAIYRIIQEALNNVIRHSKGTRCDITLVLNEQRISLKISDDGVGIETDKQIGIGMLSMRERAEELGGTIDIQSTKNNGTSLNVILPIGG